jgi:hypothetical protein
MISWRIKRARNLKGRYKSDDKSTTFNEAWVGGKAPWFKKKWKKFVQWFWKGFYKQWI